MSRWAGLPLGPPALRYTLLGGLVVGTLDGLDAIIFFGLRGAIPHRIFQTIAAGLIGRGAYEGGAATVALGVVLHYFIATMIVATYMLMSARAAVLTRRPILCGAAYGIVAFLVMNLIVVPNSALGGRFPSGLPLVNGLLIHMLGVGVPAALAARAARQRSRSVRALGSFQA